MFRCYCDACGKEIPVEDSMYRLKATKGRVTAEVMVAIDKTWNHGHICESCLLDVLNTGTRLDRLNRPTQTTTGDTTPR